MGSQRLSAREAIEALKAHQLKTVNAGILDEIRVINEQLKAWKSQLDDTEKDIAELTDKSTDLHETIHKHGNQHLQLENDHQTHARELRSLQTSYTALDQKISEMTSTSLAARQQCESLLSELREEVEQLNERVKGNEESAAQAASEARLSPAGRARVADLEQLEDRFEDFIQEVSTRFEDLQKNVGVPDSSANSILRRVEERHHVDNASQLTGPVQFSTSPRPDSNADRREPIDTYTALRASPPPLLETLPFAARREDSYVQTPSTFRSVRPTREDISNIVHTKHMKVNHVQQVPQQKPSLALSAVVPQQYTNKPEQDPGDWKVLNKILKLRQDVSESLSQYFARVENLTTKLGSNHDVIPACLRRFANGLKDERTKSFVHEWLRTSEWTVENVRDCILLLTKFSAIDNTAQAEAETVGVQAIGGIATHRHDLEDHLGPCDRSQTLSDSNAQAATRSKSQPKKLKPVTEISETQPRVQPARAAKVRNVESVKASEKPRKIATKQVSNTVDTDNQQDPKEGAGATEETSQRAGTDRSCGDVVVQQVASKRKPHHRGIGQNELKALLGTHAIEKSVQKPVTSLKRKTLHQTRQSTPQANPTHQPESQDSPPKKLNLQTRRIPKLVPRSIIAKVTSVSEASDAMALPTIPPGFDGQEEASDDGGTMNVGRKRIRQVTSGIPLLSLTTSDFCE